MPAPFPPRADGGFNFADFFTDTTAPTRYGEEHVNLLEGVGGKYFYQIASKPLNKS